MPHHGHRRRHVPVSQYRAIVEARGAAGFSDPLPDNAVARRQSMLAVLASAAVLGVVVLVALRLLAPGVTGTLTLLCLFLVVVTAAVILNAITVDAVRGSGAPDRP